MKLNDAYFGIRMFDGNSNQLNTVNIFDLYKVKYSVAKYKTLSKKKKDEIFNGKHSLSPLIFLFSDVWGRVQYEFSIKKIFTDNEELKEDVYSMYVIPNQKILLDIVDKISVSSCRDFLKQEKEKHGR